jgi:hypothetical protein
MWHLIHLIAVPLGFLVGLFCVLTAIMLYPGEEGKIQSKFEDFWVRVDDYQRLSLTRHTAFMKQVAEIETRLLDKLFGSLTSGKAFVVSTCFSSASLGIALVIISNFPLWFKCFLCFSALSNIFAAYFFDKTDKYFLYGLAGGLVFIFIIAFIEHSQIKAVFGLASSVILLIFLSWVCDFVFVVTTRKLIQWAGAMDSALRILTVVVLNILLAGCMMLPGLKIEAQSGYSVGWFIGMVSLSNIIDVVFALLFVILGAILLIHRALWPLLTRTLFRMQDIGTKGRRGILMTVGLALLGWSGAKLPELVKELVKALGKG